jgi:hypothetical protein
MLCERPHEDTWFLVLSAGAKPVGRVAKAVLSFRPAVHR